MPDAAISPYHRSRGAEAGVGVVTGWPEVTSLYLNENLSSRNRLAEDASSFLLQEGDRLSAQIAELEKKLSEFKEKNVNQ